MLARIFAAAAMFAIAATIGLNIGPHADDCARYMETTQFAAEKAAHFAKIGAAR